ncbi:hypothetical protein HanIR_Chr09g0411891 [Helianthus annuus]|nr:hypothetical protein HanIR_Chr09g0411891 [Helianthus annuus]
MITFISKSFIISQISNYFNMHCLYERIPYSTIYFYIAHTHKILNLYHKRLFLDFQNSRNATYQPSWSNKSIAHEILYST